MERLTLHAPAKLNLTLDILGGLPGGYHALDSVMLAVDLCDTLTLARTGDGVCFSCSDPALPRDGDNLVLKAADAFFDHTGILPGGLTLSLVKRIPAQAGMGGGSADAAAALIGLNHLYSAGLDQKSLAEIGLGVGSDLPFCLMGGAARAKGRGERLTPLPPPPESAVFLIAKPLEGMSTRLAFEAYDRQACKPAPRTEEMVAALSSGRLEAVGPAVSNGFEKALPLPAVAEIKAIMRECQCLGAAMTGSGTAVFGLFPDEESALPCLARLQSRFPFACLARAVPGGPKIYMGD